MSNWKQSIKGKTRGKLVFKMPRCPHCTHLLDHVIHEGNSVKEVTSYWTSTSDFDEESGAFIDNEDQEYDDESEDNVSEDETGVLCPSCREPLNIRTIEENLTKVVKEDG